MKPTPGWKTSEFWLSILGMVAGVIQAHAAPNTGIAVAGSVLTAVVGAAYSVSRATVKSTAVAATPAALTPAVHAAVASAVTAAIDSFVPPVVIAAPK